MPTNYKKVPYKLQLAYVGNSPPLFDARAFSGDSGSDRAFEYKLAFARPDNPVEAGVYGAVGSYILGSGYAHPVDGCNAVGVYAQRDPVKSFPGLLISYQRTHDSNVGPGGAAEQLQQSATSWAYALEVDESFFHGNVMLGIRPVEYLGGLQPSDAGYDVVRTAHPHYGAFDIIARDPKLSPYLYLTIESAVAASSNAIDGRPTWRVGLRLATGRRADEVRE